MRTTAWQAKRWLPLPLPEWLTLLDNKDILAANGLVLCFGPTRTQPYGNSDGKTSISTMPLTLVVQENKTDSAAALLFPAGRSWHSRTTIFLTQTLTAGPGRNIRSFSSLIRMKAIQIIWRCGLRPARHQCHRVELSVRRYTGDALAVLTEFERLHLLRRRRNGLIFFRVTPVIHGQCATGLP